MADRPNILLIKPEANPHCTRDVGVLARRHCTRDFSTRCLTATMASIRGLAARVWETMLEYTLHDVLCSEASIHANQG